MPRSGLHRALSRFFSSQKSRSSGSYSAHDGELPEPPSIAQVLSPSPQDGVFLGPSRSRSDMKLENEKLQANAQKQHTRQVSSASIPLPAAKPTFSTTRRVASESTSSTSYQAPPWSPTFSTKQEASSIQAALEQTKADLLRTTTEKHALKQQVHRQDEENQKLRDQLREAAQGHRSPLTEHGQQAAAIIELKKVNAKLKDELHAANLDATRCQQELEDTTLQLEKTTSDLKDIKTKLEAVTKDHNLLTESLQLNRSASDVLKSRLKDSESIIKSLEKRKSEADEQTTKYRNFAAALYKELQPERDRHLISEAHSTELKSLLESKTTELFRVKCELAALKREQETWRGRMDAMVHRIFTSERRVRMLNHAAQTLKTQRIGGEGPTIKRGRNIITPEQPSAEIVDAVKALNNAILRAATDFTPVFLSSTSPTWSGNFERAQVVFGEWVASLLCEEGWNRPYLLQSLIMMFLVDWCRAIIEAWYPRQQSFAELFLAGLAAQKVPMPSSKSNKPEAADIKEPIKLQAIEITPSDSSSSPNFSAWATHILKDLLQIMPAPNITQAKHPKDEFLQTLTALTRRSYDLRQALAEEDICGNVQLIVPPSDIQFQRDSMITRESTMHLDITKKAPEDPGDIAGCTGIGLRRIVIQKSDAGVSSIAYSTVLAPNVVLARDLVPKAKSISIQKKTSANVNSQRDVEKTLRKGESKSRPLTEVDEDFLKEMAETMRDLGPVMDATG